MGEALDTTKFFWDVLVNGKPKVDVQDTRVSALPENTKKRDLPGPWQRAAYSEHLQEKEGLASIIEALGMDPNLLDYTVTATWDYNGQYISEFHLSAAGTVQPFEDLSVSVQTFEADYSDDDVVRMNYDIICMINNITAGSKRVVIHAQAWGNGGGMSLGED
jgi:hypothetical protein